MSAFHSAHDFVIKDSVIVEQLSEGSKGAGLKKLLKASIPGATHDSSERYPPPLCHPGTRRNHLERLTQWGLNANNHADRITWLKGPAGVGKSAIAQSCAEALGDKLGASFFFSRPNHRDDPDRFFTSLAYQLAVKYPSYGTFLDNEIYSNPTLVKKSLPHQFYHLFIIPFRNPAIKKEITERVIIVDGLDECAHTEAQADIVKIVAESVRARTTPFLWIFFSRLEPRIVATFDLPDVKSVSQQISLPVSRRIDKEILLFLADRLLEIGRRHHLPLPWPSEEKVWALVDFSAGLFACAHAIALFVGEENPAGPVQQLHAVLRLATHLTTMQSDNHPLSALDELYTLVMERVPTSMLQTVQWILLTARIPGIDYAHKAANLLGLSELQLRSACRYLHPVMKIGAGSSARIAFYHASFMDFLEDPARSKRFCIWSDCAITLLEEVVRHLDQVQVEVNANGHLEPQLNLIWMHRKGTQWVCYGDHRRAFFKVLYSIHLNDDARSLRTLTNFDFRRLSFGRWSYPLSLTSTEVELLIRNLDSRLKLLRSCPLRNLRGCLLSDSTSRYYTIGHGKKKALLEITKQNYIYVGPYSYQAFNKWAKELREVPDYHSEDQDQKVPSVVDAAHPPLSKNPAPPAPPLTTTIHRPLSRRNRW